MDALTLRFIGAADFLAGAMAFSFDARYIPGAFVLLYAADFLVHRKRGRRRNGAAMVMTLMTIDLAVVVLALLEGAYWALPSACAQFLVLTFVAIQEKRSDRLALPEYWYMAPVMLVAAIVAFGEMGIIRADP